MLILSVICILAGLHGASLRSGGFFNQIMRALRAALFVVARAQWANYGPTRPYTFELLNRALGDEIRPLVLERLGCVSNSISCVEAAT